MEDKGLIKYDENHPFEINVYGHIYRLPRILLVDVYDSYQLINAISDITYKEKFLRWLVDNGRSGDGFALSVEQLSNIDDKIFQKYIDAFIDENEFLKEKYSENSVLDVYERFWCIIEPSLAINLSVGLGELGKAIKDLRQNFVDESLLEISQLGKVMLSGIKEALGGFDYSAYIKTITDSLISVSKHLSDIVKSIHLPTISEERKKELEVSYKKWGEYGWTSNPFADDYMLDAIPQNLQDADKIALKYCDTKSMDDLFKMMLQKCKRKSDLEEEISFYKNKHYKASAMILFSLIDSILIRKQRKSTQLKTGAGAIRLYKEDFENRTI